MLTLKPITYREARAFVQAHHRHNIPAQGWKFGVGLADGAALVGVAIVGRPIARQLEDGFTAEITRLCTLGHKNACSMLYGAARRAAFALGYRRIVTYTLQSEPGSSLRASVFHAAATTRGGSWDRAARRRADKAPTEPKTRWESLAA